jgi:hypothetical protein
MAGLVVAAVVALVVAFRLPQQKSLS